MSSSGTRVREWVGQVWRFGVVGVANTVVYYLIYRLLLLVAPYLVAHVIAFAVSVVFSFFANCWFTYRTRPTWRKFVAFPASTAVNLLFTSVGAALAVQFWGWDQRYVTLVMGVLAIPFTFLITRYVLVKPDRRGPSDSQS